MPDKKLTDNEIVKALECCSVGTFACDEQCPCFHSKSNLKINSCRFELIGDALDLINRQNAEIEELKKVDYFQWKKDLKAEAYKEFAEKVSDIAVQYYPQIQNLLKKLVGEE